MTEEQKKQLSSEITDGLPATQEVAITKVTPSKVDDNYHENSLSAIMTKIENADDAFLNSILAYSVYKDNLWTMQDLNKDLSEMTVQVDKALRDKNDFYNLKIWHFNKHFFKQIEPTFMKSIGKMKSEYGFDVDYEFKNGQYSARKDLAHAAVILSDHPSGHGKVLNVTFRGTEFSHLPSFIKDAYPDMSAYYQNFLPFEKAVIDYAKNPENNIKEIQVSGHSLGGAMVQEFLHRNPETKNIPPIKGFTYGSPGSKKNLFVKFLTIGYHAVRHQTFVIDKKSKEHDPRLNEFYHSNDPVPRLGFLGYRKNGTSHNLFDKMYEDSKAAKLENPSFLEKVPVFGKMVTYFKESILNKLQVRFHDSKRYTINIKGIIEEHYKLYPHMREEMNKKTAYWQEYLVQERAFMAMSIRYKTAFEKLIQEKNPNLTKEQTQERLLNMRAKFSYDSEAQMILARTNQDRMLTPTILGNSTVALDIKDPATHIKQLRKKYQSLMEQRSNYFKKI